MVLREAKIAHSKTYGVEKIVLVCHNGLTSRVGFCGVVVLVKSYFVPD